MGEDLKVSEVIFALILIGIDDLKFWNNFEDLLIRILSGRDNKKKIRLWMCEHHDEEAERISRKYFHAAKAPRV